MSNLTDVLKNAMNLDVHDRATLAERLLASLEELSEEEAERLWAEASLRFLRPKAPGGVPRRPS